MNAELYLIPNTLGGNDPSLVIPRKVLEIINELDHFIVENERNARRFLLKCGYNKAIDDIRFFILNKHTEKQEIQAFLNPCLNSISMGLISEAGVPAVADPGAEIITIAHKKMIRVVPLTGPSSILLALMASGMNGQHFCFNGYLPVKPGERNFRIKQMEEESGKKGITQIFIETPYRNNKLFEALLKTCKPDTLLCVACEITMPGEYIRTMRIRNWKKEKLNFNKRPAIFLIS